MNNMAAMLEDIKSKDIIKKPDYFLKFWDTDMCLPDKPKSLVKSHTQKKYKNVFDKEQMDLFHAYSDHCD